MGQTANSLHRAAESMRLGLGGLGDSRVRHASMLHGLDRQMRADAENKQVRDLQLVRLKLEADKAKDDSRMVTLNAKNFLPTGDAATPSAMSFLGGADKGRQDPLFLDAVRHVTGNPSLQLGQNFEIMDAAGKPLQVPNWKRKQIVIGATNFYMTKADPISAAEGKLMDAKMKLASMDRGWEGRKDLELQIRQAEDYLKNPANKIQLYNQHARSLMNLKSQAMSRGVDASKLTHIDQAIKRMDGKVQGIYETAQKASEAKAKVDLQKQKDAEAMKRLEKEEAGKSARAKKTEPKLPLYNRERIKSITKELSDISKMEAEGPPRDEFDLPLKPDEAAQWHSNLMLRKAGLVKEAQSLQKDKPVEDKPKGGDNGLRPDGTKKGNGWLGVLKRPDGGVSTELSIGVNIDGKETLIPSIVPTLSEQELQHLLSGGEMTDAIVRKAVAHAKKQIAQGESPFKEEQTSSDSDPLGIR